MWYGMNDRYTFRLLVTTGKNEKQKGRETRVGSGGDDAIRSRSPLAPVGSMEVCAKK
jgi:hypothetical protein